MHEHRRLRIYLPQISISPTGPAISEVLRMLECLYISFFIGLSLTCT